MGGVASTTGMINVVIPEESYGAPKDRAKGLVRAARELLDGSRSPAAITEFAAALALLPARELLRFDELSRSWYSGLDRERIARTRPRLGRHDGSKPLWEILGLVSADGHERERAVSSASPSALTTALITLRSTDWVSEVRAAALQRLAEVPADELIDTLPLAEQLARERSRGEALGALLDQRLSDDHLRVATCVDDVDTRRAAWRRLSARGVLTARELLDRAVPDPDVVVRATATTEWERFDTSGRREIAMQLTDDRVGWLAGRALAVLVALDGTEPIEHALTARSPSLRRAARGRASICGVDARAFYGARLSIDSRDALALSALAEIADQRDKEWFIVAVSDARPRVRAAGLRALAKVDRSEGRRAALATLAEGATRRVTRAAADVMRSGSLGDGEGRALARAALDPQQTPAQRARLLAALRPARWLHLAALLQARVLPANEGDRVRLDHELSAWARGSSRISRGPDSDTRDQIVALLPSVGDRTSRWIEFVLRTST
jgi:hypothetical protein